MCSPVHQELQAEVTAHRKHLNHVLEKGRSLAKSSKSDGQEVLQRCHCVSFQSRLCISCENVLFSLINDYVNCLLVFFAGAST